MRIVTWNNMVYGIGARPDLIENKVVQQLIEFTDDFQINRSWILETNSNIEQDIGYGLKIYHNLQNKKNNQ